MASSTLRAWRGQIEDLQGERDYYRRLVEIWLPDFSSYVPRRVVQLVIPRVDYVPPSAPSRALSFRAIGAVITGPSRGHSSESSSARPSPSGLVRATGVVTPQASEVAGGQDEETTSGFIAGIYRFVSQKRDTGPPSPRESSGAREQRGSQ